MEAIALFALLPVLGVLALATFLAWKLFLGLRWVFVGVLRGIGALLLHVARTLKNMLVDIVHTLGALVTAIAIVPLTLVNFLIGRWSAGRHYGRALEDELVSTLLGLYRIGLGHPLRLIGLGTLLEGLERRIPEIVDRAPRKARKGGVNEFEGYEVIGTLPTGGSGAALFLARPRPETRERLKTAERELPDEVVIKSFALEQGSTLPQIVRESRALEAANRLGLVFEHHLSEDRFYYVMRYVRGDELDTVIQRLHSRSGPAGLGTHELALMLGYAGDVLRSLDRFHTGGLWHKDVKPANVIVADDSAQLVDFGLVTPLTSAMTLTTHGTEYYRDPEMVRLAMQGVKVHEVDGVKFDLYSAGAVVFSMVEDSFPAHGSLSQVTKRCPEALQWIIRRAMADIEHRYTAAWEMLDDLQIVAEARDPFAVLPADLPSFHRRPGEAPLRPVAHPGERVEPVAAGAPGHPYLIADQRGTRSFRPSSACRSKRSLRQTARHAPVARRRRRRGVARAVVVMAIFFVAFGRWSNSHEDSYRGPSESLASSLTTSEHLYGPEREAVREAQGILDSVSYDDRIEALAERWLDHLDPVLPEPRPVHGRSQNASFEGRRILVLEDETTAIDTSALSALEHALASNGFEVLGEDDDELDIELVAGVRHAVGLGTPDDSDALGRLQSFLDDQAELDAVIWVSCPEERSQSLDCVVVRRDVILEPRGLFEMDEPAVSSSTCIYDSAGRP